MLKTLRTNRNEILSGILVSLIFFAGLFYGKTYFPPLAYVLSFGYWIMILCCVCFSPWFIIRITLPNTMGSFINEWFEAAWTSLGKPDAFRVTKDGTNIPPEQRYPEKDFRYCGELKQQFKLTILVYAVLVITGALIALAAFAQGISIPVIG